MVVMVPANGMVTDHVHDRHDMARGRMHELISNKQ